MRTLGRDEICRTAAEADEVRAVLACAEHDASDRSICKLEGKNGGNANHEGKRTSWQEYAKKGMQCDLIRPIEIL